MQMLPAKRLVCKQKVLHNVGLFDGFPMKNVSTPYCVFFAAALFFPTALKTDDLIKDRIILAV